jgi:hypothetical protein
MINVSSMAANALAEDPAERRRGPVVSGVVPSKVGCARYRDEAKPPAPQVLLGLLIDTLADEYKCQACVQITNLTCIIAIKCYIGELHY